MNSNKFGNKGGFGAPKAGGFGGGGFGGFGGNSFKQAQKQEIIIEEENKQREKMFDFDGTAIDKSLGSKYSKDRKKDIMVFAVIIIALIFGTLIGYLWSGILNDRGNVNDRIDVAVKVESVIRPKVDNFQTYAQIFKQRSESLGAGVLEYNKSFFEDVFEKYDRSNFLVDVSADVPATAITMASNSLQNPLSDIRGYAAATLALDRLITSHIEQTKLDMDEINALLGQNSATDKNIVYAIKVDANKLTSMVDIWSTPDVKTSYEKTGRTALALSSDQVYQVKRAITDDEQAHKIFAQLKADGLADDSRNFKAPSEKELKANRAFASSPVAEGLIVPNRLMYVLQDKSGKEVIAFADEILLLSRDKLYKASPNALDRYRKRMVQIIAILGDIEKTTDGLIGKLHAISTEEKL